MAEPVRVCISGIGITSALGSRPSDVWGALERDLGPEAAGVPEFDPSGYVKRRFLRPLDRVSLHCIAMVGAAFRDAGFDPATEDPSRVGIAIGSMFAGIGCIFEFKRACYEGGRDGHRGLSPLYFPGIVFNSLSGQPAIEFGFTGPNLVLNAGFCSGLLAVMRGAEYIRRGKADVVIAGGAEMDHAFIRRKFALEKDEPHIRRLGAEFRPAEAVCLFFLHKESDARFPPERRYGTLESWTAGFSSSAHPGPDWARGMRTALAAAPAPVGAAVMDGYPESEAYREERAALEEVLAGVPGLHNKRNFGHALGAGSSLNLFHGLMHSRNRLGGRPFLVDATDPAGNFAFMTVRGGNRHER